MTLIIAMSVGIPSVSWAVVRFKAAFVTQQIMGLALRPCLPVGGHVNVIGPVNLARASAAEVGSDVRPRALSQSTVSGLDRPGCLVAAVGIRLLLPGDRNRYVEESRSDLWDLAIAGAGRRGQLCYALRQLVLALRLDVKPRPSQCRKAAP